MNYIYWNYSINNSKIIALVNSRKLEMFNGKDKLNKYINYYEV